MTKRRYVVGSRGSPLARIQADIVCAELRRAHPGVDLAWREVTTRGDRQGDVPLCALGGTGAFTRELDKALLAGEVDIAVHSMKDVPTRPAEGLAMAAVPRREDPRDALVSRDGLRLESLPSGARLGTSSPRRRAQLLARRPDLIVCDARGNLDTRLRKVKEGELDGVVVALAGLNRLGYVHRAAEAFAPEAMVPAAGQGALAVQTREDDAEAIEMCLAAEDEDTRAAVTAERAFLSGLAAGCRAAVGALARVDAEGRLRLSGVVLSPDGGKALRVGRSGECHEAAALGMAAAEDILARGAGELLAQARRQAGGGEEE